MSGQKTEFKLENGKKVNLGFDTLPTSYITKCDLWLSLTGDKFHYAIPGKQKNASGYISRPLPAGTEIAVEKTIDNVHHCRLGSHKIIINKQYLKVSPNMV